VGGNYYLDDVVTQPFAVSGGALLPLDSPGLGIELRPDILAAFANA
jgi:L-alanine-DL-glutamate epimerase-like enolase superfamily enzyme